MTTYFAIRRKVDAKGRIALPKEVRKALKLDGESAVVFVKDKRRVYIRNGNHIQED